jgi:hypothetical protein
VGRLAGQEQLQIEAVCQSGVVFFFVRGGGAALLLLLKASPPASVVP